MWTRKLLPLAVLPLAIGSLPAASPAQVTSVSWHTRPTEEGSRLAMEKKNNLAHVTKSGLAVQSDVRVSMDVVIVFVRLSKGKVVAHGETAPFKLDPKASSTSTGMLLNGSLTDKHLASVAQLNLTEFVVGGFQNATKSISAGALLTDPGRAFPIGTARGGMVIAIVPADPAARQRSSARPLFVTSHPTFE